MVRRRPAQGEYGLLWYAAALAEEIRLVVHVQAVTWETRERSVRGLYANGSWSSRRQR